MDPSPSVPPRAPRWRAPSVWIGIGACVALAAVKLWLVRSQTLAPIAPAPADDELFLRQAESLMRGQWLGPLDEYTLAKGPVYSIWLAICGAFGLPLLMSQAFLYVAASLTMVVALRPAVGSAWPLLGLFLVLLYNPASWADGPATRVIRDGFYASLTLMLSGALVGTALRIGSRSRGWWPWTVGLGLVGAAFTMTREEAPWFLPATAVLLGAGLWRRYHRVGGWRAVVAPIAMATAFYALPVVLVAAINHSRYGVLTTCEVTADYFQAAYGALTRVKGTWKPRVSVPRDARARVYRASPAFREIAPVLEARAADWAVHGCKAFGVCDDVVGGWMLWAFRDAVASAGKYADGGAAARAWYERLAREVDDACRSGALDCLPPRATLAPRWNQAYLEPFLASLLHAARFLLVYDEVTPRPSPAWAGEVDIRRYEAVTHEHVPRPRASFVGSLRGSVPIVSVQVRSSSGALSPAASSVQPAGQKDGQASSLVTVDTGCSVGCRLELHGAGGLGLAIPIDPRTGILTGQLGTWKTEGFALRVADGDPLTQARLRFLEAIGRAYALLLPVLACAAALALLRSIWVGWRARAWPDTSLLALGLAGAIALRVFLLALIDATSFPAVNCLYMAPVYPLLLVATWASLATLFDGSAARGSAGRSRW